jgi:hypothetical protein
MVVWILLWERSHSTRGKHALVCGMYRHFLVLRGVTLDETLFLAGVVPHPRITPTWAN